MNFLEVVEALRNGKKVARIGGKKGIFIFMLVHDGVEHILEAAINTDFIGYDSFKILDTLPISAFFDNLWEVIP